MQQNSESGITNLPPELAVRICRYLGDEDSYNMLEAIPSWKWIMSTMSFKNQLCNIITNKWYWIDKYTYQCLFPQTETGTYRDPCGALDYRMQLAKCPFTKSFLEFQPTQIPLIRVLFVLTPNTPVYFRTRLVQTQAAKFRIYYEGRTDMFGLVIGRNYSKFNSIIFIGTMSDPNKVDLHFLSTALFPSQTLIVVILKNPNADTRLDLACLIDYFDYIGGMNNSKLGNSTFHWRLWCIHTNVNPDTSLKQLLKWLQEMWHSMHSIRDFCPRDHPQLPGRGNQLPEIAPVTRI